MRWLNPQSGKMKKGYYGVITSPLQNTISSAMKKGALWVGDNGAFTGTVTDEKFEEWLEKLKPYQETNLFIVVPDVVGNAEETIVKYHELSGYLLQEGWKISFVAQDGIKIGQDRFFVGDGELYVDLMDDFDCLFVGGSTEFKLSTLADDCIRKAQEFGKHIHIGRVNSWRRYSHFRIMRGSSEWTCDGTAIFREKYRKERFLGYEKQPPLFRI